MQPIQTKLPKVGLTIFSTMSALAVKHNAVNLGQGFPDFDCDSRLVDAVTRAMQSGHNQYPLMAGNPLLRERVSAKVESLHQVRYDPLTEITITSGATQGILSAILAVVRQGDEVIVLEPCYDSYIPNIELAGGVAVPVHLKAGSFEPDFDAIAAAMTPKTRAIIVNTPHNPSGRVWSLAQWQTLAELIAQQDIWLISDEVYEHMTFDGAEHQSAARIPALRERAFIVSSFGKTFHVTGWKIGTVCAPAALSAEFRKVHQYTVFTANSAMQQGIAEYLGDPAPYLDLPSFYQAKRDRFSRGLLKTSLRMLPCEGSYFQSVNYENLSAVRDLSERECCEWMTTEMGVTPIPMSAFYSTPTEQKVIRFCFAKRDETLDLALRKLAKLA
ncbi:MAG: aminotransferase class I/II-fold pyridoxal phosphate-dependent enzyme [Betaproteobacteria bacterium]|nr:MAG: aminotransferase class I/II-fold pyridoxal phosphate-dependent enzyme [Betaproteobacteria bacterium]